LLVGVGMLVGALVATGVHNSRAQTAAVVPEIPLHALGGAHGTGTFAVASCSIDEDGADGLFTLDFETGDLNCFILNPRNGKFTGVYSANVKTDLAVVGKAPNYAMTTGMVGWKGGRVGGFSNSSAVVYVADVNSGKYMAYGVKYNNEALVAGVPQKGMLVKLDAGTGKNVVKRDP
jgi:hypothetical protein